MMGLRIGAEVHRERIGATQTFPFDKQDASLAAHFELGRVIDLPDTEGCNVCGIPVAFVFNPGAK